ncbi:MAG: hypothetical protein ACTSXU_14840 [Promethearchaeota archaeon]
MSDNFVPLSSQLGVSGTSYRLQLGKLGNKWAVRIIKGRDVVASTVLDDLNGNMIVGFVIRETAIPNLNPYSIMKTVQFLTREAKGNEERMKKTGIPAPKPSGAPARSVATTSAPSAMQGKVDKELMSSEDVRASYRVLPKPKPDTVESPSLQANVTSNQPASVSTKPPQTRSATGRALKPIPGAGSGTSSTASSQSAPVSASTTASGEEPSKPSSQASISGDALKEINNKLTKIMDMLVGLEERLDNIESKFEK